jgi:hypothetical protein
MSTLATSSPLQLLSLPSEIVDHIFELAFIPDRLWINALHHRNVPEMLHLPPPIPPFAMLSWTIPNVGSQFCVQRFSLNRLMISKSLYAWLKSLLCHRAILQFGDAGSALSLMRRAGPYIASFGFKRVSLEVNEQVRLPGALAIDLLEVFESSFGATLDLVETRPALRQLSHMPSRDAVLERSHYVSSLGILLVRLALLSEPHDEASAHQEVRISFLLQEPMRQELLSLKDIDRHCEVFWTETGRDRYAGPTGFIRLRPKRDKESLYCHSDSRTLYFVLSDPKNIGVPPKELACPACLFQLGRWKKAKRLDELESLEIPPRPARRYRADAALDAQGDSQSSDSELSQ